MESKSILIILLIFILLGGAIIYLYYYVEKPIQEQKIEYANFNIYATDENNKVKTGVLVYLEENLFENTTTNKFSPILIQIPKNRSVKIENYNLEGQKYYKTEEIRNTFNSEDNFRLNLKLVESGNFSYVQVGELGLDKDIFLNLTFDGVLRNLKFCYKYSPKIIYLRSNEYFEKKDNCYYTNLNFNKDDNLIINLKYNYFDVLNEEDYINLVFEDENIFTKEIII